MIGPTPGNEQHRIPALDGLRGIAILLVLMQHYFLAWVRTTDNIPDRIAGNVAGIGWSGVDLFFVLSGFLITGILLDAKSGEGSYFKSFYARRFLRIFPAYYLFLFVLFILLPAIPSLSDRGDLQAIVSDQAWYWTYTNNIKLSFDASFDYGQFANGHLWSLAVEEQFYLVWPLVVFVLGRRSLLTACGLMIVGAFALRLAIRQQWLPELDDALAAHGFTPARMDALAVGALIAILAAGGAQQLSMLKRAATPAAAVALVVLATIVVATGSGTIHAFDYWIATVGLSMLALLYGAIVITAITAQPGSLLHSIGTLPVLTTFGKYSYAIYIIHFQLMIWMLNGIADSGGMPLVFGMEWPGRLSFLFMGASMSLAVAWLSWHLYESHFLKLKRYFPYGRRHPSAKEDPATPASSAAPVEAGAPGS